MIQYLYKNKMKHYYHRCWFTFFFSLISLLLSACVDLSGVGHLPEKISSHPKAQPAKNKSKAQKKVLRDGEVHTMLGGLGIFSKGMVQLRNVAAERFDVPASTTMWYDAGNESRAIINYYYTHKTHRPIILIGHSLGADEQIKVARNLDKAGIPVALLVTVDSVSQTIIPANVKYALNVYKPGFIPILRGLKITAADPQTTTIENLNVNSVPGVKVNHFTIDKDQVLQAIILDKVDKVLTNVAKKTA